ncbi:hypothetical protein KKE78_04645 [Patescibacteria group bacterium]|nr:hypothetical protein [Patescibacteria group bacterium]
MRSKTAVPGSIKYTVLGVDGEGSGIFDPISAPSLEGIMFRRTLYDFFQTSGVSLQVNGDEERRQDVLLIPETQGPLLRFFCKWEQEIEDRQGGQYLNPNRIKFRNLIPGVSAGTV